MIKAVSNGTIPNRIAKEDFLSGKTHPVNDELVKIFLQCHIVEQTRHGVPKIIKKYGIEAYDFGTSTITVTIPFDRSGFREDVQNATNNAINNAITKLTETEKNIINSISENENVTVEELSEQFGKHKTTIIRALNQLKKKGLVIRIGSDKDGHWEIMK